MFRLINPWRRYAWGSVTDIPDFLGATPDGEPVAEMWMGTHPTAPSSVRHDGAEMPLTRVAGDVPFMLKLLAAHKPLSIQVHPDVDQARRGFDRENAAGIAPDAAERLYADPHPKPEMVYALSTFDMLVGFRPTAEVLRVLSPLDTPLSRRLAAQLSADPGFDGIVRLVSTLLLDETVTDAEVCQTVDRCAELVDLGLDVRRAFATAVEVARHHPGDRGVIVTLLLNRLTLQPGEAAYLAPGIIHAHLSGLCLEAMASSDNVLRAGLTDKPIAVGELIATLQEGMSRLARVTPELHGASTDVFKVDSDAFALAVTQAAGHDASGVDLGDLGQRVVICVGGEALVENARGEEIALRRGESLFANEQDGSLRLRGTCEVAQAYRPRAGAADRLVDLL